VLSSGVLAAVFVAGLLLVGAAAVAGYLAARRRRQEILDLSAERGWTYAEEEPLLVDRFAGAPFGLGFDQRATNVAYGTHDGRDLVCFDYEYTTTSGAGQDRRTTTHRFSVLGLSMGAILPPLAVDPENVLERLVGRVTHSDIDMESETFNRAFTVSCPDRKFASDVLHPRMMEYLLEYPQLGWRFERDCLLVIARGHRTPGAIKATLEFMDGLTDLIPEFVWHRVRGAG
jgi:hypothetical protein